MRRGRRSFKSLCAVLVCAATLNVAAAAAHERPKLRRMALETAHYYDLAEQGLGQVGAWWNPKLQWYDEWLDDQSTTPLATLWGTVPLFETLDELAIAQPTTQNIAAVNEFATEEQRYWNPDLAPVPGYDPYPGDTSPTQPTYFDDNGWFGLAFLDAYQATGTLQDLYNAENAFAFASSGWDPVAGGVFFHTGTTSESGESLGAATDLAARLYQVTKDATYLTWAQTFIAWANANLRSSDGTYDSNFYEDGAIAQPSMPHDAQGAMLAALVSLCQATGLKSWCAEAERLGSATVRVLPPLVQGPQYDTIFVRDVLVLYSYDHNPRWYRFVTANARHVLDHARTASGRYLFNWNGTAGIPYGSPGMLRTEGANISVFAALATVSPPTGPR